MLTSSQRTRYSRAGLLAACCACLWIFGCREESRPVPSTAAAPSPVASRAQVEALCGACHAMPRPDSFPRDAWYDEVRRGYDFYYESGRTDVQLPPLSQVVAFFRDQAPEKLEVPTAVSSDGGLRFRSESIQVSSASATGGSASPATSFVDAIAAEATGSPRLLCSDMRNGGLWLVERPPAGEVPRRLADLHHPAAVRTCDLDANGVTDLVAADLGSFPPEDHDRGRVVWLPDALGPAPRSPVPLLAGVGRVADVSVADFDGDGREDLVVAEFGWHKTGSIRLLTRREADDDGPALVFESIVLDDRSGAIHVPVADLNTDGRPDFVALFAQEHEIVVAFLNDGAGGFERETVYDARDPSVGSSGIELVDLDRDGDLDVLYTNGDTFDSTIVKPYHGVRWLENTGEFPFRPHELTSLPGVHRALAGDLDGDGDLDIAACALLPANLLTDLDPERCDALIWLEQTTPGQFERHVLERGAPRHAAMTLADLDGDGDLDLVSGVFGGGEGLPLAVIYWNE